MVSNEDKARNALEGTPLHKLLVETNKLQSIPYHIIVAIVAMNTALIGAMWWLSHDLSDALIVSGAHVLSSGLNWWLLWRLPRAGRSFGPERPPAIALSAAQTFVLGVLGILPAPFWLALSVIALIAALAYYATWIEPFRLGVTEARFETAQWRADAPPLRLLHIGDLHVERITARERDLNRKIAALKPDIIAFSGDFVNLSYADDPEAERAIREIIAAWKAPLGVFCVPGTPVVEPPERVAAFVREMAHIRLLNNRWLTLDTPGGKLNILGLITTHDLETDRAALKKMMLKAPQKGLKLLLVHTPDIAPEAAQTGIDLYLCGHTHGGQIRVPALGALATGSEYGRRFVMGRRKVGAMTLYTTRGVGLEGLGAPRARFLCPPEIVLWEVHGTGTA